MTRVALALLLALVACADTEGEVLSSFDDGGGGGGDAAGGDDAGPDAAVDPCAIDLPCPDPTTGAITVCGRLLDVETSAPIPGDGVLAIQFLTREPPILLAETEADECGRFVAEDIFGAVSPIVVSTDDDDILGGDYTRVVSLLSTLPNNSVRTNAYAMRTATDDAWSAAAGLPGTNFSDIGALVAVYVDISESPRAPLPGLPVAGVTVTENGASAPSRDYYFSDSDPLVRSTIAPAQTQTGANGTGIISSPLITNQYGGAHGSCSFGQVMGAVPGLIQVQEMPGTCN